ncbi:hypothetical protein O7600_25130 [Micromonospora sp. WMMA1998]|uniref:hypothetical protein n=1 Tax=unclassified Micromonospora TaxID=2617518 RepID=UPI000C0591C4|nr:MULTISPECIES: hypothetical protein [unclassified Micromonospora]ATO17822.1 hypothetical protein CO540_13080 [Micromonospora sp. WMMA2032]WBC14350.1 hypothetical protein O7600_25130 [Micromonospora sp. WMMA1998]
MTTTDEHCRPHVPMRPLWLCRRCGQPWPCGAAKIVLLAEYQNASVSLFLYLAGCLHKAIDDLHRLNPSVTGSAGDMYDRFLGWPARHTRSYRLTAETPHHEE